MSTLVDPQHVVIGLRNAVSHLTYAHRNAAEAEGHQTDLTGPVRDLIFGLNSAVEALAEAIESGHFGGGATP